MPLQYHDIKKSHYSITGSVLRYVTGSAKTRHNRASLNFQYKALNVMDKLLVCFKKNYRIFLNAWFIEKETSNNKNLDII